MKFVPAPAESAIARKKAKLSHSAGRPVPWTATAASPVAATAPAITRRERSRAPRAIPTVQTDSMSP
jgi:hypothetical protein